jgi:16S rRNA (cytosine1402-N4)-methyltransferase
VKENLKIPHKPVLLKEVLEGFSNLKEGIFIDCTVGYGGHSREILLKNKDIKLIGIDKDKEAIEFNQKYLQKEFKDRVTLIRGSFSEVLPKLLEEFSSKRKKVVGILADFGVSSLQLDKKERGFAFESDFLDMRMDQSNPKSAKVVLNSYPQERLEEIFKKFGELKEAKVLAREIVKYRSSKEITSAKEFSQIIQRVVRSKGKKNPSTLPFQAVRIEVNDELKEIENFLDTLEVFKPKDSIVGLITFHSLEDRLVKNRFRKWSKRCICPPEAMRCECGGNRAFGKELNKKPITPSKQELLENPRSRSAKLRFFQFK